MKPFAAIASVILDISIDKTLDYGIVPSQLEAAQKGSRVEVPVRGHSRTGYIVEIKSGSNFKNIKPITRLLSETPLVPEELFKLALWVAKYYCAPLRDIFRIILPPSVRKGMKEKEQLFVVRGKSKEILRQVCVDIREKKPAQASVLEVMLQVKNGILLSKLLEESKSSRSSVLSLAKQQLLIVETIKIDRSPLVDEDYFMTKPKILNEDQAVALNKIDASLNAKIFQTHLIHGVTGSGKTEIYLQAIEKALKLEKGTIMLVPEISLTAQTIQRFRSRFAEKIAILHHRLSEGERRDEWHKIREGRAKIIVGARSAIFSPVVNLGLIIVDEEHEQSYKQNEMSPCYQARDVAVMRGKLAQATVVLGSATPSLESYYNALNGKYALSVLHKRADVATLPDVTIVDMRKEFERAKTLTSFSEVLLSGIERRQKQGEQVILFLNRRGYHTTLLCQDCSHIVKCTHCEIPLTFHLGDNHLSCHLCGYQISPPPKECPSCRGTKHLKFRGAGTEHVEKALHAIFPQIRTMRIDADTTKHKGSHQKLLRDFGTGKADVLIGTQMIAKGLHFPEVTLVGVLNSDAGLNIPDFRASETIFQLITQVAGRSGRGVTKGEVIIQTSMPENSTIQHAAKQDYAGFYEEEIAVREMFHYPPFSHLAKLTFSGKQPDQTYEIAQKFRELLIFQLPQHYEFNPVIPCGYAKIKDLYRYQFLLRGPSMIPLNLVLENLMQKFSIPKGIKLFVDINPSSTFF
ncbi:primosomal protein N' [Candidatus Protochlamydia sp. R18]|uniref:primosomal protein N' n=1 Tax=Candidatus Protochlamydia sp. R18 TaxID=1353977 RepID=UPI0005A8BA12|nr:primosomal protein N' [Candidatus Protochlamydia sp. R18]